MPKPLPVPIEKDGRKYFFVTDNGDPMNFHVLEEYPDASDTSDETDYRRATSWQDRIELFNKREANRLLGRSLLWLSDQPEPSERRPAA